MKRSTFLSILAVIIGFAGVIWAQYTTDLSTPVTSENPIGTTKIDEFGRVSECELGARIQNFFAELANDPDSTGYILLYNGADVLPSEYGVQGSLMDKRIRQEIAFLKLDESRVVFVEGGFRKSLTTELWRVPAGYFPPEPSDVVEKPTMPKDKTFLWGKSWVGDGNEDVGDDEFILPSVKAKQEEEEKLAELENAALNVEQADLATGGLPEETGVQSEEVPLDNEESVETVQLSPEEIRENRYSWARASFGEEIANRSKATGVLIFYADDEYYDIKKVVQFVIEGRNIIAKKSKIDRKLIKIVFGGYRNSMEAEFWIVPPKGKMPKPTPEDRPVESSQPST
jgi:hypothetical protein